MARFPLKRDLRHGSFHLRRANIQIRVSGRANCLHILLQSHSNNHLQPFTTIYNRLQPFAVIKETGRAKNGMGFAYGNDTKIARRHLKANVKKGNRRATRK